MNEHKTTVIRLPIVDHEALRNIAFFTGRSMNAIICEALRSYIETTGKRSQLEAVVMDGREQMRPLLDALVDKQHPF